MDIHDPSQNPPKPRPKFGGRLVGEKRPETAPLPLPPAPAPEPAKFGDRKTQITLTADRAVATTPIPSEPHRKVRQPRKESPYKYPGVCNVTGRQGNLDADGISSYGRSRMRARVRYTKMKCAAKHFEFMTDTLEKLRKEGIVDSSVDALIFNSAMLDRFDSALVDYQDASHYSPPKKRIRKADKIVLPHSRMNDSD